MNARTGLVALLALLLSGRVGPVSEGHGAAKSASSTQDFPIAPVRLIEPFGAGGGVDTIARAFAPKLSDLWGQPVTVENHTGAGSTVAPALVAKARPDGYTLLARRRNNADAMARSRAAREDGPAAGRLVD